MKGKMLALICASLIVMCSCSAKADKQKDTESVQTSSAQAADEQKVIPDGDYQQLEEEALPDLDSVTAAADKLFPNAKGRKLYGYTGLCDIGTENGTKSCYIFDFYTYKTKADTYDKIATLAKADGSQEIFVLDEESGEYIPAQIPEE